MTKLDRLGWVVTDWFVIEDYRFGIRTTSHAFAAWLRHALADYWVGSGDDDEVDPVYSVVVEDGTDPTGRQGTKKFHIIYYGTWDIVRTLDVRALAESLLHEIDSFTYPMRDDAVYVEASIVRGNGKTLLIPAFLVPSIAAAGRRLTSKLDLTLPGLMSVALDPQTGNLIPPAPYLRFAPDRWDRLRELLPLPAGPSDSRALVTEVTPIDRVITRRLAPHPVLQRIPKGSVLFDFAEMIRNPAMIGSRGLVTLGKAFERAEVFELQYFTTQQLTDAMAAAIGDGYYVADRTQVTPHTPSPAHGSSLESTID